MIPRLQFVKSALADGCAMDLKSEVKFDYMLSAISAIQYRIWIFSSCRWSVLKISFLDLCCPGIFAFFVFEFLHILHLKDKVKDKYLGNWRLYIKESLVICFRSVPCFWILMSLLISWLRGLFNLLFLSESSQGDLKWWWMMMIMNSLFSF